MDFYYNDFHKALMDWRLGGGYIVWTFVDSPQWIVNYTEPPFGMTESEAKEAAKTALRKGGMSESKIADELSYWE